MKEVYNRINGLAYSARANVTTSAQTLSEIFTSATQDAIENLKKVVVFNNSGNDIYFGYNSSVTTASGSVVKTATYREFDLWDWTATPYFIAGVNSDTAVELYK